jgi:dynein heavy chain
MPLQPGAGSRCCQLLSCVSWPPSAAQVATLQAQLASTQAELASLQQQVELSKKRLQRAGKLTAALADEVGRWGATAEQLGGRLAVLLGDVLLAAACISYTGAFPGGSLI